MIEDTFIYVFFLVIVTSASHMLTLWSIWRFRRFEMLIALAPVWLSIVALFVKFLNSQSTEWTILNTFVLDFVCFLLPNLLTIWVLVSDETSADRKT